MLCRCVLPFLFFVLTASLPTEIRESRKRTVKTLLAKLKRSSQDDEPFDLDKLLCDEERKQHKACRSDWKCCEERVCYKPDGFSLGNNGVCVDCIKEHDTCLDDSQCCQGNGAQDSPYLHCDKTSWYDLDGKCGRYRREGSCYTDGQCVNDCVKDLFHIYGTCT